MTNSIKNKKKISAHNKLNDLTAKEWLINTKSVWKSTDYHLNLDERKVQKEFRYLSNIISFFTKKNDVILNPNDIQEINIIGKREGRTVLTKAKNQVDFILIYAKNDFPNLILYKEKLLSDEFKSDLIQYFQFLKNNKYLLALVRDFYVQTNHEMILYHYDLANLLGNIGFNLKGLTIWIPVEKKESNLIDNPNSAIINDYFLIFRKESKKKEDPDSRSFNSELLYDENKKLPKNPLYFDSYMKSITPPRDDFKAQHPATFPEPDIKKLITFYTDINRKPKILDPFCGVGSTLIACLELNLKGYGIELTNKWIELTRERFFSRGMPIKINGKELNPPHKFPNPFINEYNKKDIVIQNLVHGDAMEKLPSFPDNYFDFIITSPPYWGILSKKIDHKTKKERVEKGYATKYTVKGKDKTFDKDLANIESYAKFLNQLKTIYNICYKKLKNHKYMAVLVSDFRDGPKFYLYHGDTANLLKEIGFGLTGLIVLHQDNKKLYPYGYPYSFVSNIHHQFIVIVKKEEV